MIRGLDDAEIEQVMAAAAPLPPEARADFLRLVMIELGGCPEVGEGAVYRAVVTIQHRFLSQTEGRARTAGKYR